MDIDALIGKNLRRIRIERGLSQDKLASIVNIPKALVSDAENAKRGIGKEIMSRICNALDVKPYEFYLETDTPIITSEREQAHIFDYRTAEQLKISEEIDNYMKYRISEAHVERRDDKSKDSLAQKKTKRRRSA